MQVAYKLIDHILKLRELGHPSYSGPHVDITLPCYPKHTDEHEEEEATKVSNDFVIVIPQVI